MIANLDLYNQKRIVVDQPTNRIRVNSRKNGSDNHTDDLDPIFTGVVQQYGFSIVDEEVCRHMALLLQDSAPVETLASSKMSVSNYEEGVRYFQSESELSLSNLSIVDETTAAYTAQFLS
ncbi:MAG TPA: hypothetical protein P5526_06950 [Anaerolineae bacterium]|nr:hypothetical protein [Anaerolineae bacterium]MCB0222654.1 hypothetical protein [Anaerolineae bacterium]MCB9103825.1 hypothetical protein [Anaerolineales bacterium]HRV91883.1 hypothetical protein [Anaerolineae bacterium]